MGIRKIGWGLALALVCCGSIDQVQAAGVQRVSLSTLTSGVWTITVPLGAEVVIDTSKIREQIAALHFPENGVLGAEMIKLGRGTGSSTKGARLVGLKPGRTQLTIWLAESRISLSVVVATSKQPTLVWEVLPGAVQPSGEIRPVTAEARQRQESDAELKVLRQRLAAAEDRLAALAPPVQLSAPTPPTPVVPLVQVEPVAIAKPRSDSPLAPVRLEKPVSSTPVGQPVAVQAPGPGVASRVAVPERVERPVEATPRVVAAASKPKGSTQSLLAAIRVPLANGSSVSAVGLLDAPQTWQSGAYRLKVSQLITRLVETGDLERSLADVKMSLGEVQQLLAGSGERAASR